MDWSIIALIVSGLICLVAGAEFLVRGASHLAALAGISSLIIGLTVVAFGTSTPELAVSVMAALAKESDISLGNVIGSNIFNVLMILGLSAIIVPLTISRQLVRFDVLVMISVSILLLLLSLDGNLSRIDGVIFLTIFVLYMLLLVRINRRNFSQSSVKSIPGVDLSHRRNGKSILRQLVFIAAGLGLLVLGSKLFVHGAVSLARILKVSELVIGLTIVAAGTSLPELFTSVVAGIRGERDIAVGNIVGSNIFNILAIMGIASLVAPGGITIADSVLQVDMPVMLIVALVCLPIFFTGMVIDRWEGLLLLAYYLLYTLYLVLGATAHAALPAFTRIIVWYVLPLTIAILLIHLIWTHHHDRKIRRKAKGES
jgi:cation:H+ antiporter